MARDDFELSLGFNDQSEISRSSRQGAAWNNKATRRKFLKRGGGATLATILACQITPQTAHAVDGVSGGSDYGPENGRCGSSPNNEHLWQPEDKQPGYFRCYWCQIVRSGFVPV